MRRYRCKLAIAISIVIFILGITLSACTSNKEPASPSSLTPTPAPSPSPSPTPVPTSVPAEQPAPTPALPPTPPTLSFKAATYSNAEYGFTIKYPESWTAEPPETGLVGKTLFAKSMSPSFVPNIAIGVSGAASPHDTIMGGAKTGVVLDLKFVSEGETTLADGTKALYSIVTFRPSIMPKFECKAYCIGVKRGEKLFNVALSTIPVYSPYDEALFSEIAGTLTFKE